MNKTCYCRTISNAAVMDSFESCYFIFLCSLGFLGVPSFPSSMRLNGNYSVLLSKHTGWAIKIRTHYFDLTLSHDEILAILKVYSFYSTLSFFWGINLFPRLTEKSSKHEVQKPKSVESYFILLMIWIFPLILDLQVSK